MYIRLLGEMYVPFNEQGILDVNAGIDSDNQKSVDLTEEEVKILLHKGLSEKIADVCECYIDECEEARFYPDACQKTLDFLKSAGYADKVPNLVYMLKLAIQYNTFLDVCC